MATFEPVLNSDTISFVCGEYTKMVPRVKQSASNGEVLVLGIHDKLVSLLDLSSVKEVLSDEVEDWLVVDWTLI
jgi:hypothetical protein